MKESLDELYHYGVLGMKWGVRRSPEELGREKANKVAKKLRKKNAVLKSKGREEAERVSRAKTWRKKNQVSWKYSKKTDKYFLKAKKYAEKNYDLLSSNIDSINPKYIDAAKQWLAYHDADMEQQFWMALAMRK